MIECLEANLTGKVIDASNPEDSVVSEEGNSGQAITSVYKASNEM